MPKNWITERQFKRIKPRLQAKYKDDILMEALVSSTVYEKHGLTIDRILFTHEVSLNEDLKTIVADESRDISNVLPELIAAFIGQAALLNSNPN